MSKGKPKKEKKMERKSKKGKEKDTKMKKLAVREPSDTGYGNIIQGIDNALDEFTSDISLSLGFPLWRRPSLLNWPEYYWPKLEWARVRRPLVDIRDNGNDIVIDAEMPGIPKEDIDVQVTENSIEICGEIKIDRKMEDEEYSLKERSYSTCYRQMPLPAEVNPDKADAVYVDGILRVTLPRKEPVPQEKKHNIKVK
jgi:HSP20 family molecular chaperone IbpA